MASVLEVRGVSKVFGAHRAVDDLSLRVERGELIALLGPSGCGKTTVLRIIAGFEQPDHGSVLLNGEDIGHKPPYERNVTTVFQNYALFPHLSVRENIEFGLRRRKMEGIDRRVRDVVEMVQLGGKENRKPAQLSGGEKQRVALARSLVVQPDLLLLDEPLAALDPNLRAQVREELKALQRRVGIAFLIVTHDQEEAMVMADQIAVMGRGRLAQVGAPRELYQKPRSRFVASFLGDVNWIGPVGVRPESIRVMHERNGDRGAAAKVVRTVFLGASNQIEAELVSGERVEAEVDATEAEFAVGDSVWLGWNADAELPLPEEAG